MRNVNKIAVVNAGAFFVRFRVRAHSESGNGDWSDRLKPGEFKVMDIRKADRLKHLEKGAEIFAEVDVIPTTGGGGAGVEKADDRVDYDPDADAVATYVASGNVAKREVLLVK